MPGRLRILLTEDDALVGLVAEAVLREAGHEVALVCDGATALALVRRSDPFDVLVTDLSMPRLDGAALVRRLRAERPSLPVGECPARC
jgi:CheY-like chemotaxis protein